MVGRLLVLINQVDADGRGNGRGSSRDGVTDAPDFRQDIRCHAICCNSGAGIDSQHSSADSAQSCGLQQCVILAARCVMTFYNHSKSWASASNSGDVHANLRASPA